MNDPIIIFLPGEPIGFARAGAKGAQRFTPAKQRNAMTDLRKAAADAMDGQPPLEGPIKIMIRASYLVPASWSRKRAAGARWKTSKPDLDNVVKLAKDALNTIAFRDDAQVAEIQAQKMYAPTASLVVTIIPLEAQ